MERICRLCEKPAGQDTCYVRVGTREHPACRACWERVLLDPLRAIRSLKGGASAAKAGRPPMFYPSEAFIP